MAALPKAEYRWRPLFTMTIDGLQRYGDWGHVATGCTLQTDRTDRQRSDSLGRTILQTVAQKPATDTKLLLLIFAFDQLAFDIFRHLSVAFDSFW